ncbi:sensor histidine kinase [Larkinella soli]|uniref:sensor histidine kinase n=1 Tax=Larkinella soli TaxID=1770527 RepID=UPI000FFB66BB|nr:ATP-binding protein [Larkinella soli]
MNEFPTLCLIVMLNLLVSEVLIRYVKSIRQARFVQARNRREKIAVQLVFSCQRALQNELLTSELRHQRQRLARDLHDCVGSKLMYLVHSLDLIMLDMSRNGHVTSRQQVEDLCQSTRETMQVLRETVWVMHQTNLTVQQFVDHLRDYLNKYLSIWDHLSHQVDTEGDLSVQLSSEQALNLFRIVQEAVTNVLRHAAASRLFIGILSSPTGGLHLQIMDDGQGFDPAEASNGVGLHSLRQRTSELGGDLTIRSSGETVSPTGWEAPVLPLPTVPKKPFRWKTAVMVTVPFETENTANAV